MKKSNKTFMLVLTALMTSIIAVLSQIAIPMPSGVPITLQTFAVALCGYILGTKRAIISLSIYILLGACGVPVFTGLTGGPAKIVGLTGGFIWGFLFLAALSGLANCRKDASPILLKQKNRALCSKAFALFFGICGLLICHILGTLQYSILSGNTFMQSALLVSIPYLPKDILSVAAALILSSAIQKGLRSAGKSLL